MKGSLSIALIAAGAILAAGGAVAPAQAQDGCAAAAPKPKRGMGGLLGAALTAMECAGTRPRADSARETPSAARPAPETATARARREMAANDAKYPSRMTIPAEWKEAKAAYEEFGKVKCFGCEGGYAYSGWPEWPRDEYSGKYGGAETRLSRLPIGHVHRWTANGFAGSLTIDGEEQVIGLRCRKMTYRLEKGGRSAERPSLMCWGKANEYAGSDSWVGVF